jgi:hypothetical protein
MPILELTDEQVVELVKQLPPERQRAALLALAEGGRAASRGTHPVRGRATAAKLRRARTRLGQAVERRARGVHRRFAP